jgi:acyl-CoA dehydrogenase
MVPAAYGGRSPAVDPLAICVVREALFGVSSHLDSLFALQGIGSYAITVAGSEAQRRMWLPEVAAARALAAFALTEPGAGSDLRAIATTVEESAGRLRVRGVKAAISNAGVAGFYTVVAREGGELSAVLVPADAGGVVCRSGPELIAPHVIGEVELDVDLPASARLGEAGDGLRVALATLSVFRASVGAAALGLAAAALKEATRHVTARVQSGRPLAKVPAVAEMMARSWTELEMARLLTYRTAALARTDPAAALPQSSMAKAAATEMAGNVVDRCVQVMGRFGLERGSRIEKLYRQARPMRIYEGANEVLWQAVARQLLSEAD